MRKGTRITLIVLASVVGGLFMLICAGILTLQQLAKTQPNKVSCLPPVKRTECYVPAEGAVFAPALHAEGNRIVTEDGKPFVLRGLMAPDPQRLQEDGCFAQAYYQRVFDFGGNALRVPIHSHRWQRDDDYLWRYLDPIVTWAVDNGRYVLLDLHFIGNIVTGEGSEMRDVGGSPLAFSIDFWKKVAAHYKDVPNVLFEIYNEPASIKAEDWVPCAVSLVQTVREAGATQLVLVSGVDYSSNLNCWKQAPLEDDNVAYIIHVFPSHTDWRARMEPLAETLPLLVTEWGFTAPLEPLSQPYLRGTVEHYAQPLADFMAEHEIGWVACWFDDRWEPRFFNEGMETLTTWGRFVQSQFQ